MRRYFYDWEFLEDGVTITPISIGIVCDDGREFYAVDQAVAEGPLYDRICGDQWLMENVVPHLPLSARPAGRKPHGRLSSASNYQGFFHLDMASNTVMPRRMMRNGVRDFLLDGWQAGLMSGDPPDIELWAWYGAYDHVALSQLWGRMVNRPQGIPMWTNDLRQEVHRLGNPQLPEQPSGAHDALEDARWLKRRWDWLQAYQSIPPPITQSCTSGA